MTTLTEYVVHSGATGSRPMWWEVCPATTREHAFDVMHHLAELTPEAFGPYGHRRLRVVEKRTEKNDLDALSTDELVARSHTVRADIDTALTNVRKVFGTQVAMCPIATCVRPEHGVWEMCEDDVGHTWFQGDMPTDPVGGIRL